MKSKKIFHYHWLWLVIFSVICNSCGVGFGADSSDGDRRSNLPVEFTEATANISFDQDNRLILINLSSLKELTGNVVQRFPCSNITIEQDILEYALSEQGRRLLLNGEPLARKSELEVSATVPGVASQLFAVWAFPETVRGDVREQITVTITASVIKFRNECRQ